MTDSQSLLMDQWLRSVREEARFARNYCPTHCILTQIFGPVRWDMSLERDRAYDRAYLELQRFGYK